VKSSGASEDSNSASVLKQSTSTLVISVIRVGCLVLLAYWCFLLLSPFLTMAVWSVIFAVALYPVFAWTADKLGGRQALTAAGIIVVSLLIIFGPATWLALSLVNTVLLLIEHFDDGSIAIPPPPEVIKSWPLIGEKVHEIWLLASTNLKALLVGVAPLLKSAGTGLLGVVGSASLNVLKFTAAVIASGFLLIPGPAMAQSAKSLLHVVIAKRSAEFIDLAGATIRNVSRGVIGVSVLQALLAGIGLIVAGVPAAGLLSFLVLFLGIAQFPSLILAPLIIWSWFAMKTTSALLFTAYMLPVSLLDNVLRPLVMAKGLSVPLPVIVVGVIGGTLAHGGIGLFVGPIVLSVAWQLLAVWLTEAAGDVANQIEASRESSGGKLPFGEAALTPTERRTATD
jgi:predicted PurR-regulated permease PerM